MENKEVVKTKSFEERMIDRIKENIGELMTEEELKKIVEKSMQKIFFSPKEIRDGRTINYEQPFLIPVVKELLEEQVKLYIISYFADNSEKFIPLVDEIIKGGMETVVKNIIQGIFQDTMQTLEWNIKSALTNNL
jgi:hypothetical protein